MNKFYEASLLGTKGVLESQLELAEIGKHRVQKVILTGGFSQSPSLQNYLRTYLEGRRNIKGWDIDLIVPRNPYVELSYRLAAYYESQAY
jgi:actin-related protein